MNSATHRAIVASLRQLDDLRVDLDTALEWGNRGKAACLLTQIQQTAAVLDELDGSKPLQEKAAAATARVVRLDRWLGRST